MGRKRPRPLAFANVTFANVTFARPQVAVYSVAGLYYCLSYDMKKAKMKNKNKTMCSLWSRRLTYMGIKGTQTDTEISIYGHKRETNRYRSPYIF